VPNGQVGLFSLKSLSLDYNRISDLSGLPTLPGLQFLSVDARPNWIHGNVDDRCVEVLLSVQAG
jgi:Leucine-rich repeat (LRR) protein